MTKKTTLKNDPYYLKGDHGRHAYLLLHGLGGGVYEMQPVGELLHGLGFSVKGINYPGHGEPVARMPDSTWGQWYGHVLESYGELAEKYESVSLVGFSTGCPLALRLAHQYPIEKLVLLSPFLAIRKQDYCPVMPETLVDPALKFISEIPRIGGLPIRDKDMRTHAQEFSPMKTFNLNAVKSALELIETVKPLLPEIKNPTLIIQSRQDNVVDPSGAELLARALGSSQKQLHWLSQSNHVITLDHEREMVLDYVSRFVRE